MRMKLMAIAFLLPLMALADTETVNGVKWTYYVEKNDGKTEAVVGTERLAAARFTAVPRYTRDKITIPSKLGGYRVTGVGDAAFRDCSGLTSVKIPEGVTKILDYGFESCGALASVTVPSTLTSIGKDAFAGCGKLKTVRVAANGDLDEVKRMLRLSGFDLTGVSVVRVTTTARLTVKSGSSTRGSVRGGGTYAAGARVQLKATAKSGSVFAGWFTDKACTKKLDPKGYDNRKPTVTITMPSKAKTVYARFISVKSDGASLRFSDATKKLAKTAKSFTASKALSLSLGFTSKSYPKVTAKGLPSGLSIDARTGKITGKVKKPGAYTVKVTVTSAAGNRITQNVKIAIKAPSWAHGSFYGYGTVVVDGKKVPVAARFTSSSVGKVSGKVTYRGKAGSFTANYASATSTEAYFTVNFAAGGARRAARMTITKKTSGLTYVHARAFLKGSFKLELQKKVSLVRKGKPLAKLVGKSYAFKKGYSGAGLTKKGDKLVVKFEDKDTAKVSGVAGGRTLNGLSVAVMARGKTTADGLTTYELVVPVVAGTIGYYRNIVFKVTIDASKNVTQVSKTFWKIQ